MLYVLLVLSILNATIRVGATILVLVKEGRVAFLGPNPCGCCILTGPVLPKGAPMGTTIHEWVHAITLAPYWIVAMNFSWLLFWQHGWLAAVVLGMALNVVVLITLESVADIGAVCIAGPRAYMEELVAAYRKIGVTPAGMVGTLLAYPVWRLYPMLVVWKEHKPAKIDQMEIDLKIDIDAIIGKAFANIQWGGTDEEV